MSVKWTWVGIVVTIASFVTGVLAGVMTLPAVQYGAFALGLAVGVSVGAIACVFIWHRKDTSKPSFEEQMKMVRGEVRRIDHELVSAQQDAISRDDAGVSGPGGSHRWKTPQQKTKELVAQQKVKSLNEERRELLAELDHLQRPASRKKAKNPV